MKKYTVTLQKQLQIIASSKEEAIILAKEIYHKEQSTLALDQYLEITIVDEAELSKVDILKNLYPSGSRIRCIKMNDPYRPIPAGMTGTVEYIDDMGTIHMHWDNGQSLGLIPEEDLFKKIDD